MAYQDRAGDVWRITFASDMGNGQVQEFNLAFKLKTDNTLDTRSGLLVKLNGDYIAQINPYQANQCTFLGTKASYLITAFKYAPVILPASQTGSAGAVQLPTQVRLVAGLKTELVGRENRGRIYAFTPAANENEAAGDPAAGYCMAWKNMLLSWFTIVSGGSTWEMSLFHRGKKGPPVIEPSATPITAVVTPTKFGTQRRSGRYGRPNTNPIV